MFHSECGQMGVRDESAMHSGQREKFAQHIGVTFRGLWYPCRFACEPCAHLPPRIAHRFRMLEHSRIGHQPHESEYAGPRQANRTGTVELLIEPVAGNRVLSK